MTGKVEEIVRKEFAKENLYDWKYHVQIVRKYANLLAEKFDGDKEIVDLSAILHDIGRIKYGGENHEITGYREAEKILKSLNYPEDKIKKVRHCVEAHRASKDVPKESLEAKILANADAMSHFDALPFLVYAGLKVNENDIDKTLEWLSDKIDRDWDEITLPEVREIAEEKYKAVRLVLDSMKEYR